MINIVQFCRNKSYTCFVEICGYPGKATTNNLSKAIKAIEIDEKTTNVD